VRVCMYGFHGCREEASRLIAKWLELDFLALLLRDKNLKMMLDGSLLYAFCLSLLVEERGPTSR